MQRKERLQPARGRGDALKGKELFELKFKDTNDYPCGDRVRIPVEGLF